jgi:hypothetical protein
LAGSLKILVVHCDLKVGGGAEAYANQLISVLRRRGLAVGILDINGHETPEGIVERPKWLKFAWAVRALSLTLFKYSLVCRFVLQISRRYDRVIYSFGEGPRCSRPTARICHAPTIFGRDLASQIFLSNAKSHSVKVELKILYSRICFWIARPSLSAGDRVLTITNSSWTARQLARTNWITSTVVYPPIALGRISDTANR